EILEGAPGIAPVVAGVSVVLAPELRVGRDGQQDAAAGEDELAGAAKKAGVVFDVLDDVEEADEVEAPRERGTGAIGVDEPPGPAAARQREVVDPGVEADRGGDARKLDQDLAVSASQVQKPRARAAVQAGARGVADRPAAVREPEMAGLDLVEEARGLI